MNAIASGFSAKIRVMSSNPRIHAISGCINMWIALITTMIVVIDVLDLRLIFSSILRFDFSFPQRIFLVIFWVMGSQRGAKSFSPWSRDSSPSAGVEACNDSHEAQGWNRVSLGGVHCPYISILECGLVGIVENGVWRIDLMFVWRDRGDLDNNL